MKWTSFLHETRAVAWWIGLFREIDLRDLLCFGGLALVTVGVWQIYPPAAWIVTGAALFWLSVRR